MGIIVAESSGSVLGACSETLTALANPKSRVVSGTS